jgi:hypothetical protein
LRRSVAIVGGLVMATSFGLAGAGVASAAVPALKVQPGSRWTFEDHGIEGTAGVRSTHLRRTGHLPPICSVTPVRGRVVGQRSE